MFSSFTSYLFGYSAEEETNESLPVQKEEEESSVEAAQTQNSDDEWELVEKESSEESIVDYSSCPCTNIQSENFFQQLPLTNELLSANLKYYDNCFERCDLPYSSKCFSLPSDMHSSMSDTNSDVSTLPEMACSGESWLVTPPPCFTAGEGTRTDISSMENLLIEHPSMSVYGPRHRLNSEGSESCCSQSSQENEGSDNQQSNNLNRTGRSLKVIRHPPRRVHAITTRIGLATQSSKNQRKSQVIQRQNFSHSISRSSLRRSNKVAQKTQRHKQATPRVLYQPSKCCVRF